MAQNKTVVIGESLAKNIAKILKIKYVPVINRTFPDSEVQPRLKNTVTASTAIVVIQKLENESINDYLIRFYLVVANIRPQVKKIVAVMPYLPYARQDKAFRKGEPLSFQLIANMISNNVDQFVTIDPHEHRLLVKNVFKVSVKNISAFAILGSQFKNEDLVIGPDKESRPFVNEFTKENHLPILVFDKVRNIKTGKVNFKSTNFKKVVANKKIVLVDDVIASGKTILQLQEELKKNGAKSVSLAFVHNMASTDVAAKMKKVGFKKILTTDTLPSTFQQITIAPVIANFLKDYLNN
ncbi:MAG: ribose-phosphate diphosphokinase [Minisyncoccia bacterium]